MSEHRSPFGADDGPGEAGSTKGRAWPRSTVSRSACSWGLTPAVSPKSITRATRWLVVRSHHVDRDGGGYRPGSHADVRGGRPFAADRDRSATNPLRQSQTPD